MRLADIIQEQADHAGDAAVFYHGTASAFDAFTPYDGALGTGVYVTSYRFVAEDYAKRRQAQTGGVARVIEVTISGKLLWNGTPAFTDLLEEASARVRKADRQGKTLPTLEVIRDLAHERNYAGYGSAENILVFDEDDVIPVKA